MKTGSIVFAIFAVAVLFGGLVHEPTHAQPEAVISGRIGVVEMSKVLQSRAQSSEWQEKRKAEEDKIEEDLMSLQRDIRLAKDDMDTREPGSDDYQRLGREWMEKQALYEARKQFYQRDLAVKEDRWAKEEQEWARGIYQKALGAIAEVAKKREFEIVMAKEMFPSPSAVLYHAEGMDITEEVIKLLDAQN